MTRLLVSVRNATEALAALAGGADVIDVKEPRRGSLGAASVETWREVAAVVAGRVPVSAALGELLTCDPQLPAQTPGDYQYAKFGLAGCREQTDWPVRWADACAQLPPTVQPVAVVYADELSAAAPDAFSIIEHGARLGCAALLVDTHQKQSGDLFAHWTRSHLQEVSAAARQRRLMVVLGGSLTSASLPDALAAQPDVIAVRGAVCRGDRTGALSGDLVAELVAQLASKGRKQAAAFPSAAIDTQD